MGCLLETYKSLISIFNKFPIGNSVFVKNVLGLLVSKGLQIVISFVQVPLLLKLLKVEEYGVWITILSIVAWAQILNFGLGNGLRNYAAQAFSIYDSVKLKKLVSTSYITLFLISLILLIIFAPTIFYLPWNNILNTNIDLLNLKIAISMVFGSFLFRFVADVIVILLKANRKEAKADLIIPFSNLIFLLFLIYFYFTSIDLNLSTISVYYLISQISLIFILSIYLFSNDYKEIKPSFTFFDKSILKDIFGLSFKFFIIQIAGIIVFSTSNIILINFNSPETVAEFNVVRQLFMIPLMIFGVLAAPLWTTTSQSLRTGEMEKLKKLFQKINQLGIVGGICLICIFIFRDFIINKWTGGIISTSFGLSLMFVIYNFFSIILSPYSQFINGSGKLNLTIYLSISKAILFIPTTIYLTKYFGAIGFLVSQFIINILPNIYFEVRQYHLIINNKAYGIWNK